MNNSFIIQCNFRVVRSRDSQVALVGPWTCDLLYSKALPDLAARLATTRINKDPYLNKGYWYDYTLINEDCKSSRALARFAELEGYGAAFLGPANPGYCSSAALYAKQWDVGILSWGCLKPNMKNGNMYPTFLRPLPLSSRVLFSVLRFFRWAHVAIISEETDVWEATGQELASSLRALGLPVNPVVTMEGDKDGPRRALTKVREADRVRVIIMCMPSVLIGGQTQYQLLTTALAMRMIDRGYVFIPYDTLLYSLPYINASYSLLGNDTNIRKAYDAVLTITMDSGERNFHEAFKDAQDRYEIRSSTPAEQVSPFFGTIYNMMYYIAMAAEKARAKGGRWVTGNILGESEGGFEYEGFNQRLRAGNNGEGMQARYVVLDYSGMGNSLYSTHALEAANTDGRTGGLKYLGRSIHFAGSTPYKDSSCWFSPYFACSGGLDSATLFLLFLVFIVLIGCGVKFFLHYKRNGGIRFSFGGLGGSNGSAKVVLTLDDLVFINTQISKRLREMRHENLNPFLGLFFDSGIFGVVTEHCTRGSLEELLNNEEVRLDWMFKSSLLMDLIRGMKYLHNHGVIHGRLKSRNCVVDGRFVLKVTDYGFNEILIAQNADIHEERPERKKTNIIDSMLRMLEQYSSNLEDLIRERTEELEVERHKTDNLVAQMLPRSVAQALKTGKPVIPEHFKEVTLYFSDIVGFTTISALSEPIEVVDLLNDLYTLFDAIIGLHDVYKVETIGDAYMVASGVPTRNGNRHAAEMANMSLDILHCIGTFKMRHMPDVKVRIRIGLHSGPVVAGVVGLTMPRYCLFGDTVNTASRMESTALVYRIHVNQSTVDVLNSLNLGYKIQLRGLTELKPLSSVWALRDPKQRLYLKVL
ncbi:hypothetical protein PAMA_005942 [Pampus argenteus]